MPAANSMANQEIVENSGLASAPPRRIFPNGRKMRTRQNSTKTLAPTMNSQSKWAIDQPLAPSKTPFAGPGAISVPTTKIRIRTAATQKTGWWMSIPHRC